MAQPQRRGRSAALAVAMALSSAWAGQATGQEPPPPPIAGQEPAVDQPPPTPAPAAAPPPASAEPAPEPARAEPAPQRCPPPPPATLPQGADGPLRQALLLEQRGQFDAAGKLLTAQLSTATGQLRTELERRVNALAQLELTQAELAAGRAKLDLTSLEKARFDLQRMAAAPLAWAFPAAAALVMQRAGLGVDPALSLAGAPWWQERLRAPTVRGVRVLVERRLGGHEDEKPVGAAQLTDGSVVAVAVVDLGQAGLKLRAWGSEASGRPRWTLTWAAAGQGGNDDVATAVVPLADGTWLAGGYVHQRGQQRPWLLRGDARGKVVFDKQLSSPGRVVSLLPLADGGAWVGVQDGGKARVVALGPSGQDLWSVALQGSLAQLTAGPKGSALIADGVPQRLRAPAGTPVVEVVKGKDLKLFTLKAPKAAALRLAEQGGAAEVQAKRGSLRVAGSGPWQLQPLGAKQWLLLGSAADAPCQRDLVWLRLQETN